MKSVPSRGPYPLDGSKRTECRQSVTRSGVGRVDRVNLSVGVGTAVRRSVTLHSLPPAMPSRVPAYRSDGYILLRDDIVRIESDSRTVSGRFEVEGAISRVEGDVAFHLAIGVLDADARLLTRPRKASLRSIFECRAFRSSKYVAQRDRVCPFFIARTYHLLR